MYPMTFEGVRAHDHRHVSPWRDTAYVPNYKGRDLIEAPGSTGVVETPHLPERELIATGGEFLSPSEYPYYNQGHLHLNEHNYHYNEIDDDNAFDRIHTHYLDTMDEDLMFQEACDQRFWEDFGKI